MTSAERLVVVGRVGRAHGRDGSFWLEDALDGARGEQAAGAAERPGRDAPPADRAGSSNPLSVGAEVFVGERRGRVERRAGTATRPLLRLDCVPDRATAAALRGRALRVAEAAAPLGAGEWLVEDLVGARVEGIGEVRRVLAAPSCDLLEVGEEGLLIPLVTDAVRAIDVASGRIEVDRSFLGLDSGSAP